MLRRAEELAELALELGRANQELEGFSYTVSHDLRAPLRHIVGFADLLREMEMSNLSERGRHFVERIVNSARVGGKLVDDLLAVSRMGRSALRPQRIELKAMVEALVADETKELGERRIEWRIGELGAVMADPVLIHLVLRNLIKNAVKSPASRPVAHIETGRRDGERNWPARTCSSPATTVWASTCATSTSCSACSSGSITSRNSTAQALVLLL